jgi:hypothetical protein
MKEIVTETDPKWGDARERVGNYLRAMKVTNEARNEEVVLHILARATRRQMEHPELRPTDLVMEELRAATARWLEQVVPGREHVTVADYLSLLTVNAPEKWPAAFLAEAVPGDLQHALLDCELSAVPELRVSSMVPEPFDPLLATVPLRNALAMLARSLALQMGKKTAPVPAGSPPPAHEPP